MKKTLKNKNLNILNVGTGKSISIDKLTKILIHKIKYKPKIIRKKLQISDPEKSNGSFKKLNKVLGINSNHFTKFDASIEKTINFFKKVNNENL